MISVATLIAVASLGLAQTPSLGIACPNAPNVTRRGRIGISVTLKRPALPSKPNSPAKRYASIRAASPVEPESLARLRPSQPQAPRPAQLVGRLQARQVPQASPNDLLPQRKRSRHRSCPTSTGLWVTGSVGLQRSPAGFIISTLVVRDIERSKRIYSEFCVLGARSAGSTRRRDKRACCASRQGRGTARSARRSGRESRRARRRPWSACRPIPGSSRRSRSARS